ncbi:hypothetical protein, partial [Vibrio campbellii]
MRSVTIRDSMTSLLMKPTLVGRDTLHELDQPLKKLAYVSNHWGPLLSVLPADINPIVVMLAVSKLTFAPKLLKASDRTL